MLDSGRASHYDDSQSEAFRRSHFRFKRPDVKRFSFVAAAILAIQFGTAGAIARATDDPVKPTQPPANPTQLIVSLLPGDPAAAEIPLPLVPEKLEATRQIFVRNADAAAKDPLAGVRFYVQLRDAQNVPVGTVKVTAEKDGATDVAIPGSGQTTAVQLKVEGIDRTGIFEGTLVATLENRALKLAKVIVERKPKPKLEFLDGPAGDAVLPLKTDVPDLAYSIRLRAADEAEVKIKSIILLPFLAPSTSPAIPVIPAVALKDE